jgi:hypothetical protein
LPKIDLDILIPRRIEEKNVKIPFKNRNEIYSFKFKKK